MHLTCFSHESHESHESVWFQHTALISLGNSIPLVVSMALQTVGPSSSRNDRYCQNLMTHCIFPESSLQYKSSTFHWHLELEANIEDRLHMVAVDFSTSKCTGIMYIPISITMLSAAPNARPNCIPVYLFLLCLYEKRFRVLTPISSARALKGMSPYGENSPSLCPTISSVIKTS
jgi:hypothetical protein